MLCNRQTAGFSYRMLMLLFYANVKHSACVRGGASVLLARAAGGCFVIFIAHLSLPVELTLCCLG